LEDKFLTLLHLALEEDLGDFGDITTDAIFSDEIAEGRIISRQSGVLSGREYCNRVFLKIDKELELDWKVSDGELFSAEKEILFFRGKIASILKAERLVLNFLGYLSGIATQTYHFQNLLRPLGGTKILDTRKTLPGFRRLAKEAVVHGGGTNHRIGLYDMVMIKDNHVDGAGGITQAVKKVRGTYQDRFPIEVECRNLDQVREALDLRVDIIMLDNMDLETCRKALAMKSPECSTKFEASGDMDENKLLDYGRLDLEYISVGKITHSVKSCNFSLRVSSLV